VIRGVCALAVLLAAGCAQIELRPDLRELEFELHGRLAANFRDESFTGNLNWRHARIGDELLISTPLGQGVARLVRQGDAVALTTAERREYRAADAESLTERVLGFRLPLTGLADWVRGRPSPTLEERGWKIEIQEYDAERRPVRMRFTYPGVELRLAVTQWN
jgi:outer membrane lipoprotein LolB